MPKKWILEVRTIYHQPHHKPQQYIIGGTQRPDLLWRDGGIMVCERTERTSTSCLWFNNNTLFSVYLYEEKSDTGSE